MVLQQFAVVFVHFLENCVLNLLNKAKIPHELAKNMLICQDASLGYFNGVRVFTLTLLPSFYTDEDCIIEKSESPSLRVLGIFLQNIQAFPLNILPVCYRLLDYFNVLKEFM
jgi:hypothetical protein